MKCKGMNKFLLLFALLLVVGVSLICISSAAIIYVPDNYASIQEAIDAASAGDTVMVRNGAYSENVVLNKSLSLIGEELPTVDAQQSGSAIEITADSCVVNGFRCVNAKYPRNAGITVFESNSNFIENITCCEKNNIGILLMDSSNNTISNNEIYENYQTGIDLWDSSNNLIYLNDFVKNTDNVYSDSSDNFWVSMSKITYVYNEKEYESHLGNYWDDYTGQGEDGDGIGETPYVIYAPLWGIDEDGSYDYCPLVQSFKNYCRK